MFLHRYRNKPSFSVPNYYYVGSIISLTDRHAANGSIYKGPAGYRHVHNYDLRMDPGFHRRVTYHGETCRQECAIKKDREEQNVSRKNVVYFLGFKRTRLRLDPRPLISCLLGLSVIVSVCLCVVLSSQFGLIMSVSLYTDGRLLNALIF